MAYPENFVIANKFTQKWEKGFVNHPNDPGGITYNGVSLRFLKQTGIDIDGDGKVTANDIKMLYKNKDQAAVDAIYYKAFWLDTGMDKLGDLSIQILIYDTSVNTGRTQSIKFLQRACNKVAPHLGTQYVMLKDDGILGENTFRLFCQICNADLVGELVQKYIQERRDFHDMLVANSPYPDGRNYKPFAKGWRNRVDDLQKYVCGKSFVNL